MFLRLAAVALLFLCSGCGEPDFPKATVIVGATLMDPLISNSVVVVQDGRIVAAGPQQSVPIPPNSAKVNGAGKFLKSDGPIRVGAPADLVLLSSDRKVERVMEGGKWITP